MELRIVFCLILYLLAGSPLLQNVIGFPNGILSELQSIDENMTAEVKGFAQDFCAELRGTEEEFKQLGTDLLRNISQVAEESEKQIQKVSLKLDECKSGNSPTSDQAFQSCSTILTEIKDLQKSATEECKATVNAVNQNILDKLNALQKSILDMADQLRSERLKLSREISRLQIVESAVLRKQQSLSSSFNPVINTGRLVSIRDSDKSQANQEKGCGGILVGERGIISFHSQKVTKERMTCIWTVRVNHRSKVAFRLLSDELGSSSQLSLTPLRSMIVNGSENSTSEPLILKSSDREEYILDGPVVFVTIISNSSTATEPNFHLHFEAIYSEGDEIPLNKYSHYHFRESMGTVNNPRSAEGANYTLNEIQTFVLNPQILEISSFNIFPKKNLKLNNNESCNLDYLSFWNGDPMIQEYNQCTPDRFYRTSFCEKDNTDGIGCEKSERWIVIFNSNDTHAGSGFKFSWAALQKSSRPESSTVIRPTMQIQCEISPNVPPKATSYPSWRKKYYAAGDNFEVTCEIDGLPKPTTLWYHNDIPVGPEFIRIKTDAAKSEYDSDEEEYTTTPARTFTILTVKNSTINGTGVYRCVASSDYGSSSAEINIQVVEEIYYPPNCHNTKYMQCDFVEMDPRGQCGSWPKNQYCCRSCTEHGQQIHTRPTTTVPPPQPKPIETVEGGSKE